MFLTSDPTLHDLHPELWPSPHLATEFREDKERLSKLGVCDPFTCVDIGKKCLPPWAGDVSVGDDSDTEPAKASVIASLAKELGGKKDRRPQKKLTLIQWVASFERYALAAATAGQWALSSAFRHKDNVMRVAKQARQRGKSQHVGVFYDSMLRQKMADLSIRNAPDFRVNSHRSTKMCSSEQSLQCRVKDRRISPRDTLANVTLPRKSSGAAKATSASGGQSHRSEGTGMTMTAARPQASRRCKKEPLGRNGQRMKNCQQPRTTGRSRSSDLTWRPIMSRLNS